MFSEYGTGDDSADDLQDPDGENEDSDRLAQSKDLLETDPNSEIRHFHNHYIGNMDLLADKPTVMHNQFPRLDQL